jgi:hypothetical protein
VQSNGTPAAAAARGSRAAAVDMVEVQPRDADRAQHVGQQRHLVGQAEIGAKHSRSRGQ